jgi:integrase
VSSTDLKLELETVSSLRRRQRQNQLESFPKVKVFLESIARNSIKPKRSYSSGLSLLQTFLNSKEVNQRYHGHKHDYNCETILQPLSENKVNVYELLDGFVSYLLATKPGMTPKSIRLYLAAVRSYFGFYDIDVIPSKFRRKVKVPKYYREDEEPLNADDIRKILLHCNNRRLKAYLLTLASGGMRTVEGLAIRLKDIEFGSPTKIHIRKEYAKTRILRDIYISDEATQYLEQWLDWKYKNGQNSGNPNHSQDDLVFTHYSKDPNVIYVKIYEEFKKLLSIARMDERKEGMRRRKYTLHSMRRFVKSIISNQVNQDYSEWFLGHSKSPYYTLKEPERREIYATKCMRYLTFLDYSALEETGKSIEPKLNEREREIFLLKQNHVSSTDAIAALGDQISEMNRKIVELEKERMKNKRYGSS